MPGIFAPKVDPNVLMNRKFDKAADHVVQLHKNGGVPEAGVVARLLPLKAEFSPTQGYLAYKELRSRLESELARQDLKSAPLSQFLSGFKSALRCDEQPVKGIRDKKREAKQIVADQASIIEKAKAKAHAIEADAAQLLSKASQASERTKASSESLLEDSKIMADGIVEAASRVLNRAKDIAIVDKAIDGAEVFDLRYRSGKKVSVSISDMQRYDDYLSVISSGRWHHQDVQAPEQFVDIVLDFHQGVLPLDSQLQVARRAGERLTCVELVRYCDLKQELNKLANNIKSLSLLPYAKELSDSRGFSVVKEGRQDEDFASWQSHVQKMFANLSPEIDKRLHSNGIGAATIKGALNRLKEEIAISHPRITGSYSLKNPYTTMLTSMGQFRDFCDDLAERVSQMDLSPSDYEETSPGTGFVE